MSGKTLPLRDLIAVHFADRAELLALSAALAQGNDAPAAWRSFMSGHTSVRSAFAYAAPGLRRLIPLMARALLDQPDALDAESRVALRAGAVWERRRVERIDILLREVIVALERARAAPVLLKGRALAALAYADPALRHCHDLDFLVDPQHVDIIKDALRPLGFTTPTVSAPLCALQLIHTDGLVLSFHHHLVPESAGLLPQAEMLSRVTTLAISDVAVRMLAPPDQLVHLLAHVAAGRAPDRIGWVADIVGLLRACPMREADWRQSVADLIQARSAIAAAALLDMLRRAFGLPIPAEVQAALAHAARQASLVERDAVILAAFVRGTHGTQLSLRTRAAILRYRVLPSPEGLRLWCIRRGRRPGNRWYLARPMLVLVKPFSRHAAQA